MNSCNYLSGFLCFILISLMGIYYYGNMHVSPDSSISDFIDINNNNEYTVIKILGAVNKPGNVAISNYPPRIIDAIKAAGGLSKQANLDVISYSDTIEDAKLISIPFNFESKVKIIYKHKQIEQESVKKKITLTYKKTTKRIPKSKIKLTGKININTASQTQLMLLPGIGEVLSNRIILQRGKKRITTPDDLLKIKGIGKKKLAKILPHVIL